MGRRNPVWTHTVRTYHSGEVVFWTPYAQEQDVIDLFASGGPVLLNPPDCCPLRRVWMAIPDLVREKIDVAGQSGIWWTLTVHAGWGTRRVHHPPRAGRQHLRRGTGRHHLSSRLRIVPHRQLLPRRLRRPAHHAAPAWGDSVKTAPVFDQVVGASHQVNTKVTLHTADGTEIGVLPVEAGTIFADATSRVDRWGGDLTLAGLEWAPDSADHPLAGLVPHEVRVQRAAHPYGGTEEWVEVARLWVYETQVSMSRSEATLQVRLGSPAHLMEGALHECAAGQWRNLPEP